MYDIIHKSESTNQMDKRTLKNIGQLHYHYLKKSSFLITEQQLNMLLNSFHSKEVFKANVLMLFILNY